MRLLRWFRDHPVALLVVAVAGLGAWIVSDMTRSPPPRVVSDVEELGRLTMIRTEPAPVRVSSAVPITKIPQLKPGMSRVTVENILGAPLPEQLGPILVQDGRATYQTTYPVDLDPVPLNTIQPARRPLPPPPPPVSRTSTEVVITLEFDASRTGHPLLRVQYPDELF
jgi:hypothetical protein